MNAPRNRLSVVGLTVLFMLLARLSLYGQVTLSAGERLNFYLDSNSHLHALFAPNGGGWTDVDLKVTDSFIPAAAAGSALTSLVDNFDQVHVYYITTNNQICDIDITGISSSGYTGLEVVPTSISGAPAPVAGSALTAFVDPTSGTSDFIHVFYEGTNENIYEFYYDGSGAPNAVYTFDDPTSLAGAPVAASGSALTSFIDGGVMHVFYLSTNNNVYELYWVSGKPWHSDDPTSLAGAPLATSGSALTSFFDGSGFMHVFYVSGQNVHELYWDGGSSWHTDDPNSLTGAPLTALGTALTSFDNTGGRGDTGGHLMYLGTNENVYALSSLTTGVWHYFDATSASGGASAGSGSKLKSFQDTVTGGVRLYFVGANAHVYELYWPSEGSASETDLTVASGSGAAAASGSSLSGVMEPN